MPPEGTDKLPARTTHKVRPSKHNMAKGALKPEDAAVRNTLDTLLSLLKVFYPPQAKRLSEILDKRAKELATQRQS